jgi:hypothetical protein
MAANPTSHIIDEDGDLALLIGPVEAQSRIIVSSKALTLASKVFKAMLTRRFKEGRELSEKLSIIYPGSLESSVANNAQLCC